MNRLLSVALISLVLVTLMACEAPLKLEGVERIMAADIVRFDQFQSVVKSDDMIVMVGSFGAVLISADKGKNWQRQSLKGHPALIDVAVCPDGSFVALELDKAVWNSDNAGNNWVSLPIDTPESPMAIACDSKGHYWVSASFSTLLTSTDKGETWTASSQEEDMVLGTIQFVDDQFVVTTGEFGGFLFSDDAGKNWQRGNDIPNEFYPLSAHFIDRKTGWVAGLNGVIFHTSNGGDTWQRESSEGTAPIYALASHEGQLYAAGNFGTLLHRVDNRWVHVPKDKPIQAYLRVLLPIDKSTLLVAGGSGALQVLPITGISAEK